GMCGDAHEQRQREGNHAGECGAPRAHRPSQHRSRGRVTHGGASFFTLDWTPRGALVIGRSLAEVEREMESKGRRFMELAVHVKLASEAVLEAARNVASLRPADGQAGTAAWRRAMDELIVMNVELALMERILRKTAGVERAPLPRAAGTVARG